MNTVIMGSGTSHGVPVVGCGCRVCSSTDPRDKRTRASLLVRSGVSEIVVDTCPEFRLQAVQYGIMRLDALLYTHAHADHLHGIDDIRPLTRTNPASVYGSPATCVELHSRFPYIFTPAGKGGGKPRIELQEIRPAGIEVGGLSIIPVPIFHGELPIYGYRIGNLAYLTDCSRIPESSYALLQNLEFLIIGALRFRPHATHFSIDEAVDEARRIGAERTVLTHLCHDATHRELSAYLPKKIEPAYDGLSLKSQDRKLRSS
jgi:phosphoribosyl 1,2-cyclic phosphate phosphodiesterase